MSSAYLQRRLARLEASSGARLVRLEPTYEPEDVAIMQRIIEQMYADPVRYAARLAVYE